VGFYYVLDDTSAGMLILGQIATMALPFGPRTGKAMSELTLLERGAMHIEQGVVAWIGYPEDAPKTDQVLDFGKRLITPGLVDAHTHPVFGGNRVNEFERRSQGATYQEIAAEGGGIQSTVRATRAATEDELVEIGRRHASWFIANGTTTIEAKSGYGLSLMDELKMLRAIKRLKKEGSLDYVPTCLGAHAFPPEHQETTHEYIDLLCDQILPAAVEEDLAEYADAFCENRYFDLAATDRILTRAKSLGLKLRIHADQLTLCGGAQLAAKLGAKTADHLEQTDLNGIRALKEASVQPVLLPASVYALGLDHYPAARAMIDEGLAVVLATDFNPGSSPSPSLPFVMSLACTHMKMTPAEALTACTVNAAYSLDRLSSRGTLEPRKRADFVVWDCEDYREIPYWIGAPVVHKVFIAGRQVF
jgi:imidazolonepropionase